MSGITNPAEEYFKDGIWGWVSTAWEKLVSSGGRLFTALHGWDGSAWRKLPLIWGYSDRMEESVSDTETTTADEEVSTTPVPAGEVHVVQAACVRWIGASCTGIQIQAVGGGTYAMLYETLSPVSGSWYMWSGEMVLKQGDRFRAPFTGLTAGDNIYLRVWGYKMKIAE